jgi:large subunit ribosomal protein L29
MTTKELREKKKGELVKLLKESRLELAKLRLERKLESLTDPSEIRKKRREVAKIITVLKEKEVLDKIEDSGEARPSQEGKEKKPSKKGQSKEDGK